MQNKLCRGRKKAKARVSSETIRRVSLNAWNALGKEWQHFDSEDQGKVLVNLLRRVGKVGEPFLGNVFKDHIITNIQEKMKEIE